MGESQSVPLEPEGVFQRFHIIVGQLRSLPRQHGRITSGNRDAQVRPEQEAARLRLDDLAHQPKLVALLANRAGQISRFGELE